MNALLLIAHGSRNTEANQEIDQLARGVARYCSDQFDFVQHAYLEFADPDIAQGIQHCADKGAMSVTVIPYFLTAGNHVLRDIPAQIDLARITHAGMSIELSAHIGAMEVMASLVAQCAKAA